MRHLSRRALRFLRQTAGVFITLVVLSFFVLLMRTGIQAQTYEYDKLGRVSRVIYDDGGYSVYEYDANGNLISRAYCGNSGAAGGEKPGGGKESAKSGHRRGMRVAGKYLLLRNLRRAFRYPSARTWHPVSAFYLTASTGSARIKTV